MCTRSTATWQALIAALGESASVLRALVNPALPREAKRRILARAARATPTRWPETPCSCSPTTAGSRCSSTCRSAYAELAADDDQILTVEVTTAVELDEASSTRCASASPRPSAARPQVTATVDPALIGGLVLRARDVLVDASVKRRLEELRRALIRTPLPVGSEA